MKILAIIIVVGVVAVAVAGVIKFNILNDDVSLEQSDGSVEASASQKAQEAANYGTVRNNINVEKNDDGNDSVLVEMGVGAAQMQIQVNDGGVSVKNSAGANTSEIEVNTATDYNSSRSNKSY